MSAPAEARPLLAGTDSQRTHASERISCPHNHYLTVDVVTPSQGAHKFTVLRPDRSGSDHELSYQQSVAEFDAAEGLDPEFQSTYQRECELSKDESKLMSLLNSNTDLDETTAAQTSFIINISLVLNIFLFFFKIYAYELSGSLSIAASVVDSFLDLCVQVVIYFSHGQMQLTRPEDRKRFPVGKSRFEPVGLVLCASLMFIAGIQLVSSSAMALWNPSSSEVAIGMSTVLVIVTVIVIKSGLWYYCYLQSDLSDSVETLAFDHRNDVLSNIAALIAILLVNLSSMLWWSDPLGCIIISLYIAHNWYELALEKIHELVGLTADEQFVDKLTQFCNHYHPECLELDSVRAYHFGQNYLVELDVILPATMTVKDSHDIALKLQHTVERMSQVERCFVHVDYEKRTVDEHSPTDVIQSNLTQIRQASVV